MNQTDSEYLQSEYGEAQRQIQMEIDWLEQVIAAAHAELGIETCSECGSANWAHDPDGNRQCGYCD